jgi:transposase
MEKLSRKGALWTPEELAILAEDRRNKVPARITAARLERPLHSVRAKGLLDTGVVVQVHKAATPEVDELITRMVHAGATDPEIAAAADRTIASVRHRIEVLKLVHVRAKPGPVLRPSKAPARQAKPEKAKSRPRFSAADIAHIRERAGKDGAAEIAQALGRTEGSIYSKASALGISLDLPRERKIPREVFEAAYAENPDSEALATRFGVHKATINRQAREYGLVAERKRRKFDDEARKAIITLAPSMTVTQVAHATGWDIRTVKRVAEEESLVFLAASRKAARKPTVARVLAPKPAKAVGQERRRQARPAEAAARPRREVLVRQADAILAAARPSGPKVAEGRAVSVGARPVSELAGKPMVASKPASKPVIRNSVPVALPPEKPRGGDTKTLSMIAQIAQRMKKDGRLPRH